MAASVCTALITRVLRVAARPGRATGRLRAETMPEVTVADRPSGEPIATTGWPTCRLAELPSARGREPGDRRP